MDWWYTHRATYTTKNRRCVATSIRKQANPSFSRCQTSTSAIWSFRANKTLCRCRSSRSRRSTSPFLSKSDHPHQSYSTNHREWQARNHLHSADKDPYWDWWQTLSLAFLLRTKDTCSQLPALRTNGWGARSVGKWVQSHFIGTCDRP